MSVQSCIDRMDSCESDPERWGCVTAWVAGARDEQLERALPLLQNELAKIPDDLRRAPAQWLQRIAEGERCPALFLARSIYARRRSRRRRGSAVGDRELRVIAAAPELSCIRRMKLFFCGISDAGVRALAESPHLRGLVSLNLSNNAIGAAGAVTLVESEGLTGLEELYLGNNRVGDKGAERLAVLPGIERLRTLVMRDCGLSQRGVKILRDCQYLSNCEVIL